MNTNKQALQDQLQVLRMQYFSNLSGKLEKMRQASATEPQWRALGHLAHTMAGSGSTFGCPELSQIARQLYDVCQQAETTPDADKDAPRKKVEPLLAALEQASQRYIERARKQAAPDAKRSAHHTTHAGTSPAAHAPLVYLVDDDTIFAENLAAHVQAAGYRVSVIDSLEALRRETAVRRPDAILMDRVLDEGELAGADATHHYAQQLHIPIIFLSVRSNTEARLATIRAGASRYLVKPDETGRILALLEQFTRKPGVHPYQILLVDDDIELSVFYARHLEAAGMQVTVFNQPLAALDSLASIQPELILLDVDMPSINGLELAALIRQQDEYSHVPIVFLSADSTIQTRLASMHLGADDFLSKPIDPAYLVTSLQARTARARTLRNGRSDLQHAMRELEFMQSALNEHAIVAITNVEGNIVYANHKFSKISGYPLSELLGKNHRFLKSGLHPEAMYETLWETISTGRVWHGTITNRAKAGHFYDVNTTIVPKLDGAGLPEQYLSIRTDVTAIKNLERIITQEAERLSMALEATESGMWEWNIASGEVIYSGSWRRMAGYPEAAEISWSMLIHPNDLDAAFSKLMAHVRGEAPAYASEHRICNAQGQWNWVREVGRVVTHGSEGEPARLIGTTQIINERIALEEQRQELQNKLMQAAKMESIGHLTAGVAHDFNNLLGGILGYAELSTELIERPDSAAKVKKYLNQISAAGNRAKELIAQMLVFSRLTPEAESEAVPITLLQPVVKEVTHLLRSSIPSSIEVSYQIADAELRARIQPVHLHQILLNLAINARDAIGEYGRIDVRLERHTLAGSCASCHAPFDGNFIELSVHDSGKGIADHLLGMIFEPFFTSKDVGKGSGMGLSVVHGIVHALGGHIAVQSISNQGTVMHILLPAVEAEPPNAAESATPPTTVADGKLTGLRIMVVDDESAIAFMLQELLSMHGAEVTTFLQPAQALAAFERKPHAADLLITDATMPDISGLDLAKAMLQIRPELPVILCTGYNAHVSAEIAKQHGIAGFMYKPLEIPKLLRVIAALTNRAPSMELKHE